MRTNFFSGIIKWKLILLVGLSHQHILFSQGNESIGNWTMFFGQLRFHDKWSFHAEAQYRDYGIFDEAEQVLLRTGINYHVNSSSFVTAGYGNISNYENDNERVQQPFVLEHRVWQQLIMRNSISRCFFEHRYRLEQRWLRSGNQTRYLNRIRYLLRLNIPINKKEIEKNTFFLSLYNEAFLQFSGSPFDRNRLYGSFAYQFSPAGNIQLGYLAQTVNITTKQYLQFAVNYNFDLRKQ